MLDVHRVLPLVQAQLRVLRHRFRHCPSEVTEFRVLRDLPLALVPRELQLGDLVRVRDGGEGIVGGGRCRGDLVARRCLADELVCDVARPREAGDNAPGGVCSRSRG